MKSISGRLLFGKVVKHRGIMNYEFRVFLFITRLRGGRSVAFFWQTLTSFLFFVLIQRKEIKEIPIAIGTRRNRMLPESSPGQAAGLARPAHTKTITFRNCI